LLLSAVFVRVHILPSIHVEQFHHTCCIAVCTALTLLASQFISHSKLNIFKKVAAQDQRVVRLMLLLKTLGSCEAFELHPGGLSSLVQVAIGVHSHPQYTIFHINQKDNTHNMNIHNDNLLIKYFFISIFIYKIL
jgi:hypothetical protein